MSDKLFQVFFVSIFFECILICWPSSPSNLIFSCQIKFFRFGMHWRVLHGYIPDVGFICLVFSSFSPTPRIYSKAILSLLVSSCKPWFHQVCNVLSHITQRLESAFFAKNPQNPQSGAKNMMILGSGRGVNQSIENLAGIKDNRVVSGTPEQNQI